jgi:hypothetical protein
LCLIHKNFTLLLMGYKQSRQSILLSSIISKQSPVEMMLDFSLTHYEVSVNLISLDVKFTCIGQAINSDVNDDSHI